MKKPKINVLLSYWVYRDGIKDYWLKINKYLSKYIKTNIIKNVNGASKNPFYFIKLAKESKKCDLLHIQHNYCLFGSLFKRINSFYAWLFYLLVKFPKGPKVITTFHDVVEPRKLNIFKRIYLEFMNLPVKLGSDKFIAHRKIVRDQLIRQGFGAKKIVVLNYGVDEPKNLRPAKEARRHFKLPEKKTVTIFGYSRPDKQYELVIYAITELPDMQLLILGDTLDENYLKFLKNEAKRLKLEKRVIFKDKIPQNMNYSWLSCGDVIVLPYSRISSSGVLSDAISTNLPIITSDIPEFKETEKQGVLKTVDVTSKQKLVKLIKQVINNPEQLKKNILLYKKKNNRDAIAKKTKQLYEEVLR